MASIIVRNTILVGIGFAFGAILASFGVPMWAVFAIWVLGWSVIEAAAVIVDLATCRARAFTTST